MDVVIDFFSNNILQILGWFIAILVAYFGIRIQERARLQQYFGELRVWALTALGHDLLISLSSKIDQGRLFFPSTQPAKFSKWKLESPNQLRQGPLSALLYAYGAVKKMSYTTKIDNDHLWEPLIDTKRDFTSAMQAILDPRNKNKQFELAMKKKSAQ